jgi:hypothetical protein
MRNYRNPFLGAAPALAPNLSADRASAAARYAALLQPSADATPLQLNSANGLAYPAPQASTFLLTYVVPSGSTLIVNGLALVNIGGAIIDYQGAVVFHALRNGAGVRGFENLYAQIGTLAQPQPAVMIFEENEILQLSVSVPQGQNAPANNYPACRVLGMLKMAVPWPNILPRK